MGYDAERGFVSTGVDPSWKVLLGDLEAHGVDEQMFLGEYGLYKGLCTRCTKSTAASATQGEEGAQTACTPTLGAACAATAA